MTFVNDYTVRINITIPKSVLNDLEKEVQERGKSGFITEAIEEKLKCKKREKALRELAVLPPAFKDVPNAADYISSMRSKEDEKRAKKLAI